MNKRALAGVVIAVLTAINGASAQERLRENERFCLETSEGGGRGGGGNGSLMCRYATFEQCLASKTSQADRCMLNPRLAGQPIR